MKVFERDDKYNFVDDNNVFVGYDSSGQCCENADYFFSKEEVVDIPDTRDYGIDIPRFNKETAGVDLEEFSFDTSYFKQIELEDDDDGEYTYTIPWARFRLTNSKGEEVFLTLYNCHNGYYSHGFEMKKGDELIHEGDL